MVETTEKLENQVSPVPATTLPSDETFAIQGFIYSKEVNKRKVDDNPGGRITGTEKEELVAFAKSAYGVEKTDLPDWVLPALRQRQQGRPLVLSVKRFSEKTLKIAPIFNAIIVSFDIRHSSTPDVREDHGEVKDHYGPLDVWLRNRVSKLPRPVFVQLQQKQPEWRTIMENYDHKLTSITYNAGNLTITCGNNSFNFHLKTIKI